MTCPNHQAGRAVVRIGEEPTQHFSDGSNGHAAEKSPETLGGAARGPRGDPNQGSDEDADPSLPRSPQELSQRDEDQGQGTDNREANQRPYEKPRSLFAGQPSDPYP